ncbi:MAG: murein biosynthesis integral membrane protein MurJ [Actinomycetota bacterium]|nr:murein biosynthesis integral membrane protein MurJ [Actinomycetota bacterium]
MPEPTESAGTNRRQSSLSRSGRAAAVGTLASRGSGFVRTVVIASALGTAALGNAYATANTIPNIVYELLLGGILTSVVVPLLVAAEHDGGGESYAQRLLSLVVYGLGALVVVLVVAAPLVIDVYGRGFTPAQRDLAVLFSRFFLPQIFFYGVGAVLGAILNTRGSYAAPMWAPVLSNVVVVATGVLFVLVTPAASRAPHELPHGSAVLLAAGTTLGIVAQTVVLVPGLRSVGFRLRLRRDLRGVGLRRTWGRARWMLVYVAANQLGLVVLVALANRAEAAARDADVVEAGYATYAYAFQLFLLPHAVVAVTVITMLLPRMSRAATAGRLADLRLDLSRGSRMAIAALVPAAVALVVLHREIAVVVFARGATSLEQAAVIGEVMAGFALGLVPFSLFQLQLRAFYALGDTRTPALVNIGVNVVNVFAAVGLYAVLAPSHRITGMAVAYALSYAVGLALTSRALGGRIGGLDGAAIVRTAARVGLCAAVAGFAAGTIVLTADDAVGTGAVAAVIVLAGGAGAGAAAFALVAWRMHIPELGALIDAALGRRGR